MANKEQLAILAQGVTIWNEWRQQNQDAQIDFSRAYLRKIALREANLRSVIFQEVDLIDSDLRKADLRGARLWQARLWQADLRKANLVGADFRRADLRSANLNGADLNGADLSGADLRKADFTEANLSNAILDNALLAEAQFSKANLTNCRIFGVSAWNVNVEGALQSNLIISNYGEPRITVDSLEVAQFVYLLIHNQKLRDVIDTIGKKAVLILGRFTDERLAVLQAIQEELRRRDYIPILFDFDKPESRDVTETVGLLAHMARFVIADLTDAKSIPQELSHIVPDLPSVAVQPLILKGQREYGMFEHWQRYPWVLPIHEYETQAQLIADLSAKVIAPVEAKVNELRPKP